MKNKNLVNNIIYNFILLIVAIFIFYIANPNSFIKNGLSIAGWFIYLPVLLLANNTSLKNSWLWGGLYGIFSYMLYASWLTSFHPLALLLVCTLYFFIMAFIFTSLKIIDILFPRNGWIIQFLLLCSYEYLKTLGFIGFSYGVSAYTQWKNIYFIQIANITGVFGLNLLLIFPSAWIYNFAVNKSYLKRNNYIFAALWFSMVLASYIYGGIKVLSVSGNENRTVKIAAIQSNEDPWKSGINEYSKNVQTLKHLTEEALEFYPDVDFVLWPETAVVPSIMYQFYKLIDEKRFRVVYSLLNYMDSKDCVFVIGNSHEEENKRRNTERYNSALVFVPGENVIPPEPQMYSKIHLVPFTESFPYKNNFPNLYARLLNGDTHMWNQGAEYTVFSEKELRFSTPICFEDTFGNDCRKFVKNGARCFMNMSNDAWSKSVECQYQHLAMAVFRSVENRIPTVRSTSSGQTCFINDCGIVERMIPEFCESFLVGEVPLLNDNFIMSPYTKYGDIAGKLEVLILIIVLLIQIFNVIIIKIKDR